MAKVKNEYGVVVDYDKGWSVIPTKDDIDKRKE